MTGADTMTTETKPNIRDEIAAYDAMRAELEAAHFGEWVLIHGGKMEGDFSSFDEAARNAVERFGRGPYLIRQVGAPALTLPTSVLYGPIHAVNSVRV